MYHNVVVKIECVRCWYETIKLHNLWTIIIEGFNLRFISIFISFNNIEINMGPIAEICIFSTHFWVRCFVPITDETIHIKLEIDSILNGEEP